MNTLKVLITWVDDHLDNTSPVKSNGCEDCTVNDEHFVVKYVLIVKDLWNLYTL